MPSAADILPGPLIAWAPPHPGPDEEFEPEHFPNPILLPTILVPPDDEEDAAVMLRGGTATALREAEDAAAAAGGGSDGFGYEGTRLLGMRIFHDDVCCSLAHKFLTLMCEL